MKNAARSTHHAILSLRAGRDFADFCEEKGIAETMVEFFNQIENAPVHVPDQPSEHEPTASPSFVDLIEHKKVFGK